MREDGGRASVREDGVRASVAHLPLGKKIPDKIFLEFFFTKKPYFRRDKRGSNAGKSADSIARAKRARRALLL